jgi:hypothetical protein
MEPPSKAQSPNRCQFGLCLNSLETGLLLGRPEIRGRPMRQLRCHANALSHHGLQLNFFANVYRVGTHLNRQSDLTDV